MDIRSLGKLVLKSPVGEPLLDSMTHLLYRDGVRRRLFNGMLSKALRLQPTAPGSADLKSVLSEATARDLPDRLGFERRLIARAILRTVDRLLARRAIAPDVLRVIAGLWGKAMCILPTERPPGRRFLERRGCAPPWLLVLSPGHACNLRCAGCYAMAGADDAQLPWSIVDRIMREAQSQWGVPLIAFSGGEPLAYRSEGKDLLDLVEKHAGLLYLMFTNGTLLSDRTVQRLAQLGNLTPAISVEGLRERTDARRGSGAFDQSLRAAARLRQAGVPFGISIMVTGDNCEEVLSDEFIDLFFEGQGAFYGFLFHYMPIGRGASLQGAMSPAQRVEFWRRSWEVIERRGVLLLDFWNHGPLVGGCISAGRELGYLYIDWNGNVLPCVFAPYVGTNILDLYARGGTLDDAWEAPLFKGMRQWQREYGYGEPSLTAKGNWLRPCPMRDHHQDLRRLVAASSAAPADEAADAALTDEAYYRDLVAYGIRLRECSQPLWEQIYVRQIETSRDFQD